MEKLQLVYIAALSFVSHWTCEPVTGRLCSMVAEATGLKLMPGSWNDDFWEIWYVHRVGPAATNFVNHGCTHCNMCLFNMYDHGRLCLFKYVFYYVRNCQSDTVCAECISTGMCLYVCECSRAVARTQCSMYFLYICMFVYIARPRAINSQLTNIGRAKQSFW